MDTNQWMQKDKDTIVNSYARFEVCLERGENATCYDVEGKRYIDFGSGIGVNSLGYADETWVAAVTAQLKKMQHCSNLYYSTPDIELAEKLLHFTGYDKVFFANSGAEANECAIKTARKRSFDRYGEGRNKILTLVNSFHGRTITTLAATGQSVFHQYFHPFTEGFAYLQPNDLDALTDALDDSVCGIMMEMIQGEGGVMPLDVDYVQAVAAICQQRDIALIVDEVQTGIGRTGKLLAAEHFGIKPDIVTLAKGLGGGLPIGAILMQGDYADVLGYSMHGTTFGGNPAVCAGAVAVLDRVCQPAFLSAVTEKGEYIRAQLSAINEIEGIDGLGLMLGLRLKTKSAAEVAKTCVKNGLLILTAKTKLRLLPPLTITKEEIDQGIAVLKAALEEDRKEPTL